ncbi:MAG TPA: cardiolipin synthase [Bacilli bacterium]|nr:cardiolipin synthase [Bacilli bacterium]
MELIGIILIIIYSLNIIAVISLVFFENRSYSSLLVWLLVLMALPGVGLFAYVIFGKGPDIGKKKKFLTKITEDEKYFAHLEMQKKLLIEDTHLSDAAAQLAYYNLIDQGSVLTDTNKLEVMHDIAAMYETMFQDIENATEYVNILFFIIKGDEYGKRLRELLIKKVNEGVKVRLIYDHVGSFRLRPFFFRRLKKAGGEVYSFLPSIFKFFFRNVNYRNHRKIVIVDGKIAYTGGANVGREYANKDKKLYPWHDTQIRVEGDAVTLINLRFMQDYNFSAHKAEKMKFTPQKKAGNKVMQIISSGPDSRDEKIKLAYIKAIYNARTKVYIQTPYFIPDESFIAALATAAKSGVDVRIMIPGIADKKSVYLSTTFYMKELLPHGVRFYTYNGFMHSKTLLIDDEITSIGTFNIDIRSFKQNFEMTVFIYDKAVNAQMTKAFFNETKNAKLVPADYKGRIIRRFFESIARLFTPLM